MSPEISLLTRGGRSRFEPGTAIARFADQLAALGAAQKWALEEFSEVRLQQDEISRLNRWSIWVEKPITFPMGITPDARAVVLALWPLQCDTALPG